MTDVSCLNGSVSQRSHFSTSNDRVVATNDRGAAKASLVERLRRVFGELFSLVDDALRDKGGRLDERIIRASELLRNDPELHRLLMPETPNGAAAGGRARNGGIGVEPALRGARGRVVQLDRPERRPQTIV